MVQLYTIKHESTRYNLLLESNCSRYQPQAGGITTTKIYSFTTKSKPKIEDLQISNETPYQNQPVNILSNISEDTKMDEVKLVIEYPDSSTVNKTIYKHQWTTLTYDDFENGWGNYTDGGADCSLWKNRQ